MYLGRRCEINGLCKWWSFIIISTLF
jgi:hypothetical protein